MTVAGKIHIEKLDGILQAMPRADHRLVVTSLSALYRRRTMLAREQRAKERAMRRSWIPGRGFV